MVVQRQLSQVAEVLNVQVGRHGADEYGLLLEGIQGDAFVDHERWNADGQGTGAVPQEGSGDGGVREKDPRGIPVL